MKTSQKVVLVTGASSGMGRGFAETLAEAGFTVYAAARRMEKLNELTASGIKPLKMDITKSQEIQQAVKTINKEAGGVDILINNAGFGLYGAMEDTTIADARYQFEVNLFGLAELTKQVLPGMRAKNSGKIINISSMGGKVYTLFGSWYHATKHALEGWSDCLRLEVEPFGINVVVIEPGGIETEFGDVAMTQAMERSGKGVYKDRLNAMMKRFGEQPIKLSKPAVITALVMKAVHAKRPKTRYVGGAYAKPSLFIRKWLGDRIFDRVITGMVK